MTYLGIHLAKHSEPVDGTDRLLEDTLPSVFSFGDSIHTHLEIAASTLGILLVDVYGKTLQRAGGHDGYAFELYCKCNGRAAPPCEFDLLIELID